MTVIGDLFDGITSLPLRGVHSNRLFKLGNAFLLAWLASLLLGTLVGTLAFRWFGRFPDTLSSSEMSDFRTFYVAAELIRNGAGPDLYDVAEQRAVGAPDPILSGTPTVFYSQPIVAILSLPLTTVSVRAGFLVWTAISLVLIAISVLFALKLMPSTPLGLRVLMVAMLASTYPLQHSLAVGQLVPITMASLALGLWLISTGKERTAGFAFGIGLLKYPFVLGPVLFLALSGKWQALRILVVIACAMLIISLGVVGPRGLGENAQLIMKSATDESSSYGTDIKGMLNWRGFSAYAFDSYSGFAYFGGTIATSMIAVLAALRVWSKSGHLVPEGLAACVLLSWFLANQVHFQDMILVWIALCLMVEAASRRNHPGLRVLLAGGWFLWFDLDWHLPFSQYHFTVFPMLGLLALLVYWSSRPSVYEPHPRQRRLGSTFSGLNASAIFGTEEV